MKKIILTKKRLKRLDTALCIDDILYEKMRRMEERTNMILRRWRRENQVASVLMKKKDGILYRMNITKEIKTGNGIYVEITE